MAQQFLKAAQIGPRTKKVGGEAMPQSMRRRRIGQTHDASGLRRGFLHNTLSKRAAFDPAKQRVILADRPRAFINIVVHCGANHWKERHDTLLTALAGQRQRFPQR